MLVPAVPVRVRQARSRIRRELGIDHDSGLLNRLYVVLNVGILQDAVHLRNV